MKTALLLPKILQINRNKRRAVSFDRTVESDISLDASEAIIDPPKSSGSPKIDRSISSFKDKSPIIIEDRSPSLFEDLLYKNNIALRNRVAAFNAQQKLLGKYHPDVLFSLQTLAGLHYRRQEYDHAQRIFKEHTYRQEQLDIQGKQMEVPIPSIIFLPC
mmetsp:Transcript_11294/g.16595  ORF Transcript_11294/g.16595 Transcript_11294/m.16595 type:complete len:160 (-) Transcript_11294:337-816(-)